MLKHIAIIMDGNRRWAKKRGFFKIFGHREGANTIKKAVDFCLDKKISYLSLYTFSIENFKRPEYEKSFLFNLMVKEAQKALPGLIKKGVCARFIGDRSLFPKKVLHACDTLERETKSCNNLQLHFLFCYGGRQEILSGVRNIAKKVKSGELSEDEISETILEQHLWMAGIPDPDLIIRTGGHVRLSNFLLYQSAYSELFFLDCMWPEITADHLDKVVLEYNNRKRNFGI